MLLTTREAAQRIGVKGRRIRQLCEQGEFPGARKVGWGWLIPEEDVVAYLTRYTPGHRASGHDEPEARRAFAMR